jgi:CO/xanthine dehydrogenase Mo-binding subunit
VLATGQVLRQSIGARAVLERCVKRSEYRRKRRAYDRFNRDSRQPMWKGVGLAVVHHGSGFTGGGEVMLASRASVVLSRNGTITTLAASTEIGQGTTTMLAQMTAEALGVPVDWIAVEAPDTWKVPNSGPTVASRTCMIVGGLVQRAARRLRKRLVDIAGAVPTSPSAFARAAQGVCGEEHEVRIDEEYRKPPEIIWDEDSYRGDAYAVFSYAAAVVDLEIDKRTCEVTVRKVTTAQDVGKAINPLLVEGQIIGGTVQGLGYALLEHVVYRDGVMHNAQLTNYVIPTSLDVPPMDVTLVEQPYSRGPWGAKGVGELPMDVPAPAVAAAIFHATGLWMPDLPILPEKILAAHLASHRPDRQSEAPAVRRSTVSAPDRRAS